MSTPSDDSNPSADPVEQPNISLSDSSGTDPDALLQLLRRKEQTWVDWGQACATLQKLGYGSQKIFEETGFEPIHQNQVIVAAQVYTSLVKGEAPEAIQAHFRRKGSDILYELRILNQTQRIAATELVLAQNLDMDEARELAKAIKESPSTSHIPEGFTNHPGDAIAYQSWRLAQQQRDLQERSRLIGKGLKFAHSETARQQLQQLLIDFTVVPQRPAPRLPIYRLESDENLPRIVPVVGELPLTLEDLQAVPLLEEVEPFRIVKFSGAGAWVGLPGWQVVLNAEDPVAILARPENLPNSAPITADQRSRQVLLVIDRAQRQWDADSYFLVKNTNQLEVQWFDQATQIQLYGKLVLILLPRRILDENQANELWQIEE
ncbi:MAG: RuBisCO accumulation factor 1 [Microcoleaceae cyanobacterium]